MGKDDSMKLLPILLLLIGFLLGSLNSWGEEEYCQGYTPDTEILCISCGQIIKTEMDKGTFKFWCNLASWRVTCRYCNKKYSVNRDYDHMINGHGQLGIREREYIEDVEIFNSN